MEALFTSQSKIQECLHLTLVPFLLQGAMSSLTNTMQMRTFPTHLYLQRNISWSNLEPHTSCRWRTRQHGPGHGYELGLLWGLPVPLPKGCLWWPQGERLLWGTVLLHAQKRWRRKSILAWSHQWVTHLGLSASAQDSQGKERTTPDLEL